MTCCCLLSSDTAITVGILSFFPPRDNSGIIDRSWSELSNFLDENGVEVNAVSGNGFCLLAAVARSLLFDHSYLSSVARIQERVLDHLIRRGELYDGFHNGTVASLATEAANFYEDRIFDRELLDILVLAVADALGLRIKILRQSPEGKIQVLIVEGQNPLLEVLLKFHTHDDPRNPDYVGANHYDAITKKNNLANQLAAQLEEIEEEEQSTFRPVTDISADAQSYVIRGDSTSQESERLENPDYGTDAIRSEHFSQEFDGTSYVICNEPAAEENNQINTQASISGILSEIFHAVPESGESSAIRNEEADDFSKEVDIASSSAYLKDTST